ncbi:MAG: anhydro-N-acetylmuramic acid kinase [Ignavibacteriaceae bacterium]
MNKDNCDIDIKVIGVMSGTSLDGLDICFVHFTKENNNWKYKILNTEAKTYPEEIKNKLASAQLMDAFSYARFNSDYGICLGQRIKKFIDKHSIKPDLIASHGHTIFHQPAIRFTAQIGSGACIASETGVDTVCDFRTSDVALYGQGAPLVPIGDRYLFSDYDYCLNLGGFSNISFEENDQRIAYDICPVNYVLNHYMRSIGKDFDKDGKTARSGKINKGLLEDLNKLSFYSQSGPKSLGREDVEKDFIPLIDFYKLSLEDKLATFCEHIAIQIGNTIKNGKVIVTGGGAFNNYLIERMQKVTPQCVYHIPDEQTINFKEALIFAFLGALYLYDIPNCLASVTGARHNNIGGALYKAIK